MLTKAQFTKQFILRTKQAREASGFDPAKIAGFLRIKKDTYNKYESRTPLPQYLIPPFCDLCKIDADWLFRVEEASRTVRKRPFPD